MKSINEILNLTFDEYLNKFDLMTDVKRLLETYYTYNPDIINDFPLERIESQVFYDTFLDVVRSLSDGEIISSSFDYDRFFYCLNMAMYCKGRLESIRWMLRGCGLIVDSLCVIYEMTNQTQFYSPYKYKRDEEDLKSIEKGTKLRHTDIIYYNDEVSDITPYDLYMMNDDPYSELPRLQLRYNEEESSPYLTRFKNALEKVVPYLIWYHYDGIQTIVSNFKIKVDFEFYTTGDQRMYGFRVFKSEEVT